jgi:hypothetical protein
MKGCLIIATLMSLAPAQAQYVPWTIPPEQWRNYWFNSDLKRQLELFCRDEHLRYSQDYHRLAVARRQLNPADGDRCRGIR